MRTSPNYFWTLTLAVIFAIMTRLFLVTAYKVPTGSMQPTLKPGDFIFASKVNYGIISFGSGWFFRWSKPERNEVVVFTYPDQPDVKYVKRVIAVAGDEVKIENDELWLNGQKLDYAIVENEKENPNPEIFNIWTESDLGKQRQIIKVKSAKTKTFGPLKIPDGHVFLLGDNRDVSEDSRSWGTVPSESVIAKVQLVWLSLDWQKKWVQNRLPLIRWDRFFLKIK